jgi:hypothetical protein
MDAGSRAKASFNSVSFFQLSLYQLNGRKEYLAGVVVEGGSIVESPRPIKLGVVVVGCPIRAKWPAQIGCDTSGRRINAPEPLELCDRQTAWAP